MFFRSSTSQAEESEIGSLLNKIYRHQKKINLHKSIWVNRANIFFYYASRLLAACIIPYSHLGSNCTVKPGLFESSTNMLMADFKDGEFIYNKNYYLHMSRIINGIPQNKIDESMNLIKDGNAYFLAPRLTPGIDYQYDNNAWFSDYLGSGFCKFRNDYSRIILYSFSASMFLWFTLYLANWYFEKNPSGSAGIEGYDNDYSLTEEFLTGMMDDFLELDNNDLELLSKLDLIDENHRPKYICDISRGFIVNPVVIEVTQGNQIISKIFDLDHVHNWVTKHNKTPTFQAIHSYRFSDTVNKEHKKYLSAFADTVKELKLKKTIKPDYI